MSLRISLGIGSIVMILLLLGGAIWGVQALAHSANSDNRACLRAHGHIVESGIDGGKACVDDGWKLVRP